MTSHLWIITFPAGREALVYGDFTQEQAVALALQSMPTYSPARNQGPCSVREAEAPTLIWRPTNW